MAGGIKGDEFDDLVTRTRRALDDVRGSGAADDAEQEPAVGEAAEGMVRATLAPGGKLSEIVVDPKLLREGIETVCEHVVVATNAAIDELRGRSPIVGAPDVDALAGQLRELQDDSVRRMAAFGTTLDDVVAQLRRER